MQLREEYCVESERVLEPNASASASHVAESEVEEPQRPAQQTAPADRKARVVPPRRKVQPPTVPVPPPPPRDVPPPPPPPRDMPPRVVPPKVVSARVVLPQKLALAETSLHKDVQKRREAFIASYVLQCHGQESPKLAIRQVEWGDAYTRLARLINERTGMGRVDEQAVTVAFNAMRLTVQNEVREQELDTS